MKKYLLNYVIVGAMALLTVVGLQSFDKAAKAEKASTVVQDCTDELIWFEVKVGDGILCSNYELIEPENLILHPANSFDPLEDMDSFKYNQQEAMNETGCLTTTAFTCAVGYAADASNFDDIGGEWVPNSVPVCTVCRPTP